MGLTLTNAEIAALEAKGAKVGPRANVTDDQPRPEPEKLTLDQDALILAMPTATIYIPGWHPQSLNKALGMHWAKRGRHKRADMALVFAAARMQGVAKATGKRRVDLHLLMKPGQRRPDSDNIWKGILDALVHAELLVNDSPEWLEQGKVTYSRSEGDSNFGTFILLRDV